MYCQYMETPLRPLRIEADADAVTAVNFLSPEETERYRKAQAERGNHRETKEMSETGDGRKALPSAESAAFSEMPSALTRRAAEELSEYFSGKRKNFDLPVRQDGTPFQKRCWEALCRIPYGETRSYGQQAAMVKSPKASRAVGGANHRNRVCILIPCHRVIGADGSLTGFGGGLDAKEFLLSLEKENS